MTKWMTLKDFPRGGRILLLGKSILTVLTVRYLNEDDLLVEMDARSYLHNGDRLILAQDCWPKTSATKRATVFIGYES